MHKMQKTTSRNHLGWKRLVRSPCRIKGKTNRAKWKAAFHRRKWIQRAANHIAKGDHSANHSPNIILKRGKQ
jgi:hypothetical protein